MEEFDPGYRESLLAVPVPYDPFLNPPNFALAHKHQQATSVGASRLDPSSSQRCPCCQSIINKVPLSLFCDQEQLAFLGVAHPLYFRLSKYYALIIVVIFVISGGVWNMYTGLACVESCEYFLGVGIYNPSAVSISQWTHVVTCIAITLFTLYLRHKILEDIEKYKDLLNCPSQYTFMLQNLPQTINQGTLGQWVEGLAEEKPVKINLSYDLTVYEQAYAKKTSMVFEVNKMKIQSEKLQLTVPFNREETQKIETKIQQMSHQLHDLNRTLREFNTEQNPPVPTGTAFVTMNSKQKVIQFVDLHGDSFFRSLKNSLFGFVKAQYPQYGNSSVLVSSAPSPRDVIWQNLLFSFVRNFIFTLISLITMAVILVLAFRIQGYMVRYAYKLRQEGVQTGKLIIILESLSMSGIVVIVNSVLRLVIQQFSKAQKYYSYTKYNSSFANSYFLLYFFNSALTVYIVHGNLKESTSELILWDIHVILIANAFSEPLSRLLDPTMYWRYFQRLRIQRQKPTPYTQKEVNSIWEGHSLSMADNYAYINRILFVTMWFAAAAPMGILVSLAGLFLTYWIDKIFLLRVNKMPETISEEIASKFLIGLELLPLIYLCGALQFTYNISTSSNLIEFLWQFLSHGVVLLVFLISIIAYFSFWRHQEVKPPEPSYRQVQYHFKYQYDIQNPITTYNAELQYLRKLLQSADLDAESSRKIEEILEKSMYESGSGDDMSRRMEIAGIKEKMGRQLSKETVEMQRMSGSRSSQ